MQIQILISLQIFEPPQNQAGALLHDIKLQNIYISKHAEIQSI